MLDRRAPLLVTLAVAACVFPSSEPTGIEFSWRFLEANTIDGDEAVRARSCAAAEVDRIAVHIEDADSPSRQGTFRFPCGDGFQTLTEFQTEASDAFVQLSPGEYEVSLLALDPGGLDRDAEALESRTVDVVKRQITTEPWNVTRAPVDWTIALSGAAECTEFTLALYYDEPQAQLPEYVPEEDDDDAPLLYRRSLGSSGGILLDGTPTECGADLDGAHLFAGVDRGAYVLQVAVDGLSCSIRLGIGTEGAALPVNLANLPCAG